MSIKNDVSKKIAMLENDFSLRSIRFRIGRTNPFLSLAFKKLQPSNVNQYNKKNVNLSRRSRVNFFYFVHALETPLFRPFGLCEENDSKNVHYP